MTNTEIDMLRHAVGADSGMPGYRKHYCTEPNDGVALSLVAQDLFTGPHYTNGLLPPGLAYFYATEKAFKLLGISNYE